MTNYKILFHLESEEFSVLEIKRFFPNETDKSRIYFWLLFDKQDAKLRKLNFVSMHSDGDTQFRVFTNEQLSFDSQKALLILNNEEQQLDVIPSCCELNTQLQEAVGVFLKQL